MLTTRAWLGRNVLIALVATGCSLVLQPEELSTRTVIDAGSEASVNPIACSRDADCDSPKSFSPEGCAVSSCVDQVCAFFAPDKDGDGAPMACRSLVPSRVVNGSAEGVDCDDTNPRVFPGTFVECGESETGETLLSSQADAGAGPMFAKPKGACTIGKRSCGKDGKISACIGTVGPKAEVCAADNQDENCDGSVNEGCTCSPENATESCGSTSVGECKKGARMCTGGKWSPCSGNVEPAAKTCTSAADNDCNGLADNTEYNLQTDANNCGVCGKVCGAGSCVAGVCGKAAPAKIASFQDGGYLVQDANYVYATTLGISGPKNELHRIAKIGGNLQTLDGIYPTWDLEFGGTVLYWTSPGSTELTIYQRPNRGAGGRSPVTTIASAVGSSASELVVSGTDIVFTSWANNAVYRVPVTGGTPTPINGSYLRAEGLVKDPAGVVYFSADSGVYSIAGSVATQVSPIAQRRLAADDLYLYGSPFGIGTLRRIRKTDGAIVELATGQNFGMGSVFVLDGIVYWTCRDSNEVKKVSRDGGTITTIATGTATVMKEPTDIVVDATTIYWTADDGLWSVAK